VIDRDDGRVSAGRLEQDLLCHDRLVFLFLFSVLILFLFLYAIVIVIARFVDGFAPASNVEADNTTEFRTERVNDRLGDSTNGLQWFAMQCLLSF